MGRYLVYTLLILISSSAIAQYQFENKKAEKLYNKLEKYYEDYDYERLLEEEEILLATLATREDTLTALMYSMLGESYYYGREDLQNSLAYYDKEYALRSKLEKAGMPFDKEIFLYTYASVNTEAQNYSKAEALYTQLLEIPSEDYMSNVLAVADFYSRTSQPDKGEKLLARNKKHVRKHSYEEAMYLKFAADYHEMQGEFSKAEKKYQQALDILDGAGYYPSLEYVYIMNELALLYTNKSQYPIAEEIYLQSLNILERLGEDEASEADVKFNLAQVYFELGQYQKALDEYLKILETDKELYGADSYYAATTSFVIGDIYTDLKQYDKAEAYLTAAVRTFESLGENNTPEYARTLNNLMRLYTFTKDFNKAVEYAGKSMTAYKAAFGDDHHEYALSLSNASDVYQKAGNLAIAETYLKEADKIRAKKLGKDHPMYALSTRKLAILNWKKASLDDALNYYESTFDNFFGQINTYFPVLSEEEKAKFYYTRLKPTFEEFNSFIVENKSEQKELLGKMYDYQLATKGLILYATNKVRESILNSGDSVLISKYETWIEQKEQLARLFSAADMPLEERNLQIDSLSTVSNTLEKELSLQSSVFAQTFTNRDLTWQDVKAKLKPGEAAVEIIRFRDFTPDSAGVFTDEVYYAALIVTPETEAPELVLMRNGKLMESRFLSNYRNAIKYKVDEDFSYRLFWKPIANKLEGIKKVYFSPDGVFNQISIYTLRNPETGKFTLDEMEIQVLTNTKDLVAFNKNASGEGSYLFGYPNYNMGAIDDVAQPTSEAEDIAKAVKENRGVRGAERGVRGQEDAEDLASLTRGGSIPRGLRGNLLRYMRSNQSLALLPGTKKEVNLIDSLYKKRNLPATIYLSNEALEDSIKNIKNARTLHIATHGFFLENDNSGDGQTDQYVENPLLRSGLILAGANSFISRGKISDQVKFSEDGILTAYEAMNLNLDKTELVVLSACETGLGEVQNGEGVYGLQRAFQVAGADAIIMSMWTVDDEATQELMTSFYEEWLTGADKQTAFINAQKRLKDKWKSPYYWGAFVMIGM